MTDNRLPRCVSARTAEWLLGEKALHTEDDARWIDDLAREFVFADMSYRTLVKMIVTSPRYRRVR